MTWAVAMCRRGGQVPWISRFLDKANGTYGALSSAELIDAVIRPAMLKQEVVPSFERLDKAWRCVYH